MGRSLYISCWTQKPTELVSSRNNVDSVCSVEAREEEPLVAKDDFLSG